MEKLNTKEYAVLVASNKDITLPYSDLFEQHIIDTSNIYLEKKVQGLDYSNQNRLIIVPSGIVSLFTKDTDFLWGNYENEEYRILLEDLNRYAREGNMTIENKEKTLLSKEFKIGNREYDIAIFPYNDIRSSSNLMKEIEEKQERIKHL